MINKSIYLQIFCGTNIRFILWVVRLEQIPTRLDGLYIVLAILGAQGPRYLFSRAMKEQGRTQFEGLGPQYCSYNTQFYNIEAFSSQKPVKTSAWFEFPAFFSNFREKIMRGIFFPTNYFWQTGKRPWAHFWNHGRNPALSAQSGPISPGKSAVVWNWGWGSDLEQTPDL